MLPRLELTFSILPLKHVPSGMPRQCGPGEQVPAESGPAMSSIESEDRSMEILYGLLK